MSIDLNLLNTVIARYFSKEEAKNVVPVKLLMDDFIQAGLFKKDIRNGLPIRDVLKRLRKDGRLEEIPQLHYVVKGKDVYWYFKREGAEVESLEVDNIPTKEKSKRYINKQLESDKHYVIDLCDRTLRETALRMHTFDYLLGDMHRNGRTRSKLPCDAYYSTLKLIVEYNERTLVESVDDSEIPQGQKDNRAERDTLRAVYAQRKRDVLGKRGYTVVDIDHSEFDMDASGKIIRDRIKDMKKIGQLIGQYAKDETG